MTTEKEQCTHNYLKVVLQTRNSVSNVVAHTYTIKYFDHLNKL